MPRIILKCRYLKHEKAHLAHLVRYIATREGVEMARDTHDHLPATARQKQLIDELLRALPDTQESYEYRDYQANPTMGNASAFIAISIEQNMDLVAKKENYVDYIASRPGVEKRGHMDCLPMPVCRSYCHEYRKKSPDMKGTYGPSYFPYGERMQCD